MERYHPNLVIVYRLEGGMGRSGGFWFNHNNFTCPTIPPLLAVNYS